MWAPVTEPWQFRVLDMNPPSVDDASLREAKRLTVEQRIENVMRLNQLAADLRQAMHSAR